MTNTAFAIAPVARTISLSVLAGIGAALIAGGIGSRVAMRIAGALTDRCTGLETEAGFECGEITVFGIVALLILGALVFGPPGGLIYAAARPWLMGLRRWHGLVFGLLMLVTFGPNVITDDNVDFRLFGEPAINILLFAVLFLLFGVLISLLAGRLDRGLPRIPPDSSIDFRARVGYVLIGLLAPLSLAAIAPIALEGSRDPEIRAIGSDPIYLALFVYIVVALPMTRVMLASTKGAQRINGFAQSAVPHVVGYAIAGAPVVAGLVLSSLTLVDILSG